MTDSIERREPLFINTASY